MANILLLDDSDVAGRAMQGILARGNHTCFVATKPDEAWRIMREGVVFDLVFCELKLGGSATTSFLQRLREDWFWKILPAVVYTYEADAKLVRKALGLRVQNYLIKPYNDELIFAEIAKATKNPWRNLHFEEPRSFCALTGLSADTLKVMRRDVMTGYDRAVQTFPDWAERRQNEEVFAQIAALATAAESAGIWAGVDFLRELQEQAAVGNWSTFRTCAEPLEFASRLIFCQLNPSYAPDCMRTEEQRVEAREAAERVRWERTDVTAGGPLLDPAALLKQVDALPGCPVVDTTAAAFQMLADGRAASMTQVMDLVVSDPGLCAQVLAAANRVEHDEMTVIDDGRAGASLLGELKLNALAKALPVAAERYLAGGLMTWPAFWMFQVGVGRVAQFVCSYLEFDYLASSAYTAGLLHDIGKLALLKLHPFALSAIVTHAREKRIPLADAERRYLGCTTRELGTRLAVTHGLPAVYANVIRWAEAPALATEHSELVAMVSLARHICLHAHVGCSGDAPPSGGAASLASTPAWCVLRSQVFPSFDVKKFEVQAHAFCLTLRGELSGQRGERRPSHAQRAAELV